LATVSTVWPSDSGELQKSKATQVFVWPRVRKRRARDSNSQPHYWGTTFPVGQEVPDQRVERRRKSLFVGQVTQFGGLASSTEIHQYPWILQSYCSAEPQAGRYGQTMPPSQICGLAAETPDCRESRWKSASKMCPLRRGIGAHLVT
jgi:hypothetical protein